MTGFPIDDSMAAHAFTISKQTAHGRHFEGNIAGRQLRILYQRKFYRGNTRIRTYTSSSFHVYVNVPQIKTRAQIGPYARAVSKMKKVAVNDTLYDDMVVMGLSPEWARALATSASTRPHIETLLEAYDEVGSQVALIITPGSIQVIGEMKDDQMTDERVHSIIEAAAQLGNEAEALPADYEPVEATSDEKRVAEGKIATKAILILVGVFVAMIMLGACITGAAIAISILLR